MNVGALEREAAERAQFTLRMRSRGFSDIRVLRSLERTPRSFFVPQRYADLFTEIPQHRFRVDISSSAIRARASTAGRP